VPRDFHDSGSNGGLTSLNKGAYQMVVGEVIEIQLNGDEYRTPFSGA